MENKEVENLGNDIDHETGNFRPAWHFETEQNWAENHERVIGKGAECVVTELNRRPQEVVAFRYSNMPPARAKQTYYAHRIFSTLFPHNFPRFVAAFAEDQEKGRLGGTVRKKVEGRRIHFWEKPPNSIELGATRLAKKLAILVNPSIKFPFSRVVDFKRKTGTAGLFDHFDDNFMIGADGGQYFVDTIHPYGKKFVWDFDKILDYMNVNNYSPKDRRTVEMSLNRLKNLDLAEDRNHYF